MGEKQKEKCVPIDSNMLLQKALNLDEDFSKGSSEANDHNDITCMRVHCYNCSILLLVIVIHVLPLLVSNTKVYIGLCV